MNQYDINLLQDPFIYRKRDTDIIANEWRDQHFWSYGNCHSQGVGSLFAESFQGMIGQSLILNDREDRILSITVEVNDTTVQACNVYCLTDTTERSKFLDNLPGTSKGCTPL